MIENEFAVRFDELCQGAKGKAKVSAQLIPGGISIDVKGTYIDTFVAAVALVGDISGQVLNHRARKGKAELYRTTQDMHEMLTATLCTALEKHVGEEEAMEIMAEILFEQCKGMATKMIEMENEKWAERLL